MDTYRMLGVVAMVLLYFSGQARSGNPLPLVTVEFPPFAYTDADGRSVGASTQIVTEAVSRMGYEPVVDTLPTKRAQQMTVEGAYSALFPVTKSEKRAGYCVFSEPVSYFADVFFKRRSDDISWEQLDDLVGQVVGTTDGYNYAPVFLEAVRDGRLTVDPVVSASPELQHLKKLVKGRIDLAICERSVCAHLVKKHQPAFDSLDFIPKPVGPMRGYHVCFSRKRPDAESLADDFNRAMRQMREEGRLKVILDHYGVIATSD